MPLLLTIIIIIIIIIIIQYIIICYHKAIKQVMKTVLERKKIHK